MCLHGAQLQTHQHHAPPALMCLASGRELVRLQVACVARFQHARMAGIQDQGRLILSSTG